MKNLNAKFKKLNAKKRFYELENPIIALTGGIATGKSSVRKLFKEQGLFTLCADELVKEVYQLSETKTFIRNNFPQVIDSENNINFKKLRTVAFNNKEELKKLEDFLHPRLQKVFKSKLPDDMTTVLYDIPLLFEKKLSPLFDVIITVSVDKKTQIERLMDRDKIDNVLAEKIIRSQVPLVEKKEQSDFVIENNGNVDELKNATLGLASHLLTT